MHDQPDATPINQPDDPLVTALASLPLRPAPPGVAESFRRRLAQERTTRPLLSRRMIIGIAATLLLAVSAGWWHERQLRLDDGVRAESQLAAALQNVSTGARMAAIDATVRDGRHGDAVEQALITTLLSDPNTNVRMAAAEALGRVARPDVLRQAVRRALIAESSPFVQTTLLHVAERLPAADRRGAIAPLLVRTDIDPMVSSDARERAREQSKGDSR
jgi:hypothetical protein